MLEDGGRLQELCQSRGWVLPRRQCGRVGQSRLVVVLLLLVCGHGACGRKDLVELSAEIERNRYRYADVTQSINTGTRMDDSDSDSDGHSY